ncbi:unnamed protein product [Allacma fusca]|uniref:Uncharacterized protein n=1 Tax=Allacma fusca TaxID=39272 RepID=A0A8J2KWW1_9HEXA|nr:unnamed protein product [Allacma fusca]
MWSTPSGELSLGRDLAKVIRNCWGFSKTYFWHLVT